MTKSGFATLVGRPNAGKSTLLNKLVGERLAIVSPKPQSTRDRVVGILSDETSQIVLLDTPGLLEPRYALQKVMRFASQQAIQDADVIVHLVDSTTGRPDDLVVLAGLEAAPKAPIILALNKSDQLGAERKQRIQEEYPGAVFLSAATGEGIPALLDAIRQRLPESPFLYDPEDVSTQQLRFFVGEFIREAALEQLDDEVPYSIGVEIEEFRETTTPVYIRAVLHVERDSQKRILIGADGARIKALGVAARARIEPLVGSPIYLDLWVKVLHNWRRNTASLARLGYRLPDPPRS